MEENKDKNMWMMIGGVAVIVVLVLVFWMGGKDKDDLASDEVNDDNGALVVDESVSEDGVEDVSEGSVKHSPSTDTTGDTTVPASVISYQEALVKYADARIQLDSTCQASPDNMTFKDGTNIMIDNRSAVDRTIKVGSVFKVKAWGFKIVKLSTATKPVTWFVDCDGSQNVSTILIQD